MAAAGAGAHAVFGPCNAIYDDDTPAWMRRGDYHSNRIHWRRPINTGYTSNVLLDLRFARRHQLRFDPALGRTGGEDTMFFHAMHRAGASLAYAPDAVVHEDVARPRMSLNWIARRRYRAGQVYAMMFDRYDRTRYRRLSFAAPLKIATCAIMSLATAAFPSRAMAWVVRGAFHSGMLSYALGASLYQEYSANAHIRQYSGRSLDRNRP